MSKLVLHLFHDDAPSLSTAPALAERMHQAPDGSATTLELYIFGPAEGALATPDQPERKAFNAQIDSLVLQGVRVTTCIGLAQKFGVEAAFRARGITLESAALAFPRFAAEAATVISF